MNPLFDVGRRAPTDARFRGLAEGVRTTRAEAEVSARLALATAAADEQATARDRAVQEAEAACNADWAERYEAALATERTAVQHACASFVTARARFFANAEAEIVRLALVFAAKVLARAVADDGAAVAERVRAVLAAVDPGADTCLEVGAEDEAAWTRFAASVPRLRVMVCAELPRGECRLRGPQGLTELGAAAQLKTIEAGALTLLEQRTA